VAFRRAVWASVALHVAAACALVLLPRSGERKALQAGIDTFAEPQVRISLPEEAVVSVPPVPAPPLAAEVTAAQAPVPATPQVVARAAPQLLPPELVARIRQPAPQPVGAAVVEVPVAPGALNASPAADPNVTPVGGTTGTEAGPPAPPLHGALRPNQTVVYVLDCSGSMGAAGKFDAARAVLVSTLKLQPPTVRFQVIVYAGTAGPLLASDGNALPATGANVRAAAEKLATLEPRGHSDHYGAVRAAVAFRPDVILVLTDGDDLSAAVVKSVVAAAPHPVPVCVGRVTAGGVQPLRVLK
jgi:hypothetical protein